MENLNIVREIMTMLISTDTTNPPGNELALVNKIVDFLALKPTEYKIINCGDNRADLVIDVLGKKVGKYTTFVGHLDTVTVSDHKYWKYPPFKAYCDGENIYGRGACDMKGGVTAMILLYKRLKSSPPEFPVRFVFTADEEKNGIGIAAAYKNGVFDDVDQVIICEPTSLKIGVCEKGAVWLNFKIFGKSCHAAHPSEGVNAIENAFELLNGLKFEIENRAQPYKLLGKNSFQITEIKSGTQINIIPDCACASVDLRTIPQQNNTNADILNFINQYVYDYKLHNSGVDIEYGILCNRESISNNADSGNVQRIVDILRNNYIEPEYIGINFFTDGSLFIPQTKIPFVILGPGKQKECHTVNEKIEIKEIAKAVEIYFQIVK